MKIILQNSGEDPCLVLHRPGSSKVESGRWSRLVPSQEGLHPGTGCSSLTQQPRAVREARVSLVPDWTGGLPSPFSFSGSWGSESRGPRAKRTVGPCPGNAPGNQAFTSARWVNPVGPTHLTEPKVRSHPGGNKAGRTQPPRGQKLLCCLWLWRCPAHPRCSMDTQRVVDVFIQQTLVAIQRRCQAQCGVSGQ